MPANPERMRPTPLSYAPIVKEANEIVMREAVKVHLQYGKIRDEAKDENQKKVGEVMVYNAHQFIKNTLLDKEEKGKEAA